MYAAQGKEAEAFNARFRLSELNGNDASRLVEVASELLEAGAPGLALRACEQAGAAVAARVLASRAHAALKDTAAALEAAAAAIALDRARLSLPSAFVPPQAGHFWPGLLASRALTHPLCVA